jgi:hypothetical protein
MGVATSDEDLVEKILNSLPKSWTTFRQIQRGKNRMPSFPELERLLFQEEVIKNIERDHEDLEEAFYIHGSYRSIGDSFCGRTNRG